MKKEKSTEKKKKNILSNILSFLLILSAALLIYSLLLITGIETEIRILAIIVLVLINILLLIVFRKLGKKHKTLSRIILLFIFIIAFGLQAVLGLFILKTYSSIDNMNKDKITYETALITLKNSKYTKENLSKAKIGIISDETSIDGYIIAQDIIKENNLNENNIELYTDNSNLVSALYEKEIDAIFISINYPSMFKSIEKYENIEADTKILLSKEKTYTKKQIEKLNNTSSTTLSKNNSSITEPFTMLIMGIDSTKENLAKNATGNGDTLMVITFNPKTLNATILSIPRDTYVPIACFANQKENKITHAAWNGESCMIKTIENFTGIDIDYYVKINFKGVVKLVDALGGIELDVPIEFCEQDSNRKKDKNHELCLKKGYQTLNGEQALALARHRKTLPTGDLQRGENQQLVVQAILNKAKSVKSATDALNILNAVSNSMDTNFTTKQILSFYEIAKVVLLSSSSENPFNIQQLKLAGSDQYIYDESMRMALYNYIPNKDSLKLIVTAMKENLNLTKVQDSQKTMNFNIEEKYEIKTIGKSNIGATKLYTLLPDFTGKTLSYATSWLSSHGVKYQIQEKESTGTADIILSQSLPKSKRIDLIDSKGITLTVSKKPTPVVTEPTPQEPDINDDTEETPPQEETPTTPPTENTDPPKEDNEQQQSE